MAAPNDNTFNYNPFFEESACPMYIIDIENFRIIDANPPAQKLYGYTKEEFTALSLFDIRYADEASNKHLASDIQSGRRDAFHDGGLSRHKRKNGEPFYVHVYSQPAHYEGRMAGLVIVIDENERVLSEQENAKLSKIVQAQKTQLDDLLTAIKDVVWSTTADTFAITYINEACTELYGYTPAEMKEDYRIFIDLILPEDRPGFDAKRKDLFVNGSARHEFRIRHRNGDIKHILVEAFVKYNAEGTPQTINGISIDITNEKIATEKVKDQHKKLQDIAWLQSHKVRSHVATIMGLIGLFDAAALDRHNKELLDNIYQTAKTLDDVIREINRNTSSD